MVVTSQTDTTAIARSQPNRRGTGPYRRSNWAAPGSWLLGKSSRASYRRAYRLDGEILMNSVSWVVGTLMLSVPLGCFMFLTAQGSIGNKELLPITLTTAVSCLFGYLSFAIKRWKED